MGENEAVAHGQAVELVGALRCRIVEARRYLASVDALLSDVERGLRSFVPVERRRIVKEQAIDPVEWARFLRYLQALFGGSFSVSDITSVLKAEQVGKRNTYLTHVLPRDLAEALRQGDASFCRRLGWSFAVRVGVVVGESGLSIIRSGMRRKSHVWRVWSEGEGTDSTSGKEESYAS